MSALDGLDGCLKTAATLTKSLGHPRDDRVRTVVPPGATPHIELAFTSRTGDLEFRFDAERPSLRHAATTTSVCIASRHGEIRRAFMTSCRMPHTRAEFELRSRSLVVVDTSVDAAYQPSRNCRCACGRRCIRWSIESSAQGSCVSCQRRRTARASVSKARQGRALGYKF